MKILIFGKNGQLGYSICQLTKSLGEIFALDSNDCNLCDVEDIENNIFKYKPNIIINAAAYTNVDLAEEEIILCNAINSNALKIIAQAANKIDALVIHFSTDYIFDGLKKTPYNECDQTNPINEYGKSKLYGELFLKKYNKKNIIIRTSWIFSHYKKNFLNTILDLAKKNKKISIINDQIGSPTSAYLISKMVIMIIKKYRDTNQKTFPFGTYNITSNGEVTWYEFAKEIIKQMNIINNSQTNVALIPILSDNYASKAKRPKYSVLSNTLFQNIFGIQLPSWKDQINRELLKKRIV